MKISFLILQGLKRKERKGKPAPYRFALTHSAFGGSLVLPDHPLAVLLWSAVRPGGQRSYSASP